MIFIAHVYATKQDMGDECCTYMFLLLHDFFFFVKVSKPNMVWAKNRGRLLKSVPFMVKAAPMM